MNLDVDINTLRSLVTGFSFILFIGVMVWAYRPSRKAAFDEAAQLPFINAANRDQES